MVADNDTKIFNGIVITNRERLYMIGYSNGCRAAFSAVWCGGGLVLVLVVAVAADY